MMSPAINMYMLGGHLSVYAGFWSKKESRFKDGIFIFDTGASVTTISEDALVDLDGKLHMITTASGIEYVKEVTVDKIRIGSHVFENVMLYAHTFPEELLTTGVIGLNVLSQFDIKLLFSKQLIELTKIEDI